MLPSRAAALPAARAQAGALGAAMATLSARSRAPTLPGGLFPHLQPPSPDRLRHLLAPPGAVRGNAEIKLARVSAVAQLDSVPGRFDRQIDSLLDSEERTRFAACVHHRDALHAKNVAICRHCSTSHRLQYPDAPPHAVMVNHGARIETDFDADSNISRAAITDFQMFVRGQALARQVIRMAHPLRWKEASPMFERADPAVRRPTNHGVGWSAPILDSVGRELAIAEWRERHEGYVYENVGWSWNEFFGSKAENIIHITNLDDDSQGLTLNFDYALEKCLITNFGVAWERGGLDVDSGSYRGRITAHDALEASDVPANAPDGYPHEEVDAQTVARERRLDDDQRIQRRLKALRALGGQLSKQWGEKAHLVTISASKQLRYTRMRNSPDELRAFLNWTSPALLFVFINRSVCQTVHLLPD